MQQEELVTKLSDGWQTIHQQSGQAIEWIGQARRSAQRLDNEADHLVLKLRRARNLASSLYKVSQSASTVGFFGLSQAGKSYLISALAAGANGNLETVLDGQRLDFVDHVNPPGGGKEATGLVTRFTRRGQAQVPGFPLQLQLFTEVELVKILTNSLFNDFNQEKTGFSFEGSLAKQAHDALNALQSQRQSTPTGGVTEDDVVDLWDYLRERYPRRIAPLEGDFLPRLVDLAPYLSADQRADLFAFLWGQVDSFTELFKRLSTQLTRLSHARTVLAPMSALVEAAPSGEGFIQRDSIMN
ncbi:MAG: virulence factor SrfC family protein, partial [Orrella sp.]